MRARTVRNVCVAAAGVVVLTLIAPLSARADQPFILSGVSLSTTKTSRNSDEPAVLTASANASVSYTGYEIGI